MTASPEVRPSEDVVVAHRKLEHFGQVLPIEDVEKVIDLVDSITRMPCGCRFFTTGKADKRYCFGFGLDKWAILGRFPDAAIPGGPGQGGGEEDIPALRRGRADAQHLDRRYAVRCRPMQLRSRLWRLQGLHRDAGGAQLLRAEYVCRTDWDLCTGCKACMSQCQFGAQFYSSALGKVYIDPTRCFGCGVCRAACPNDCHRAIPQTGER